MATSSQQQTLQQSFERQEKYSKNSKQWKKLTNSVAYCIVKDMMPFFTVKRRGFKYMLSVFNEKYDLPCRKYISNTAIPKLYSSTKEVIDKNLKK